MGASGRNDNGPYLAVPGGSGKSGRMDGGICIVRGVGNGSGAHART